MLLLLWLFQIVFLNRFYESIKINEIYSTCKTIENTLTSAELEDTIEKISHTNDICILLYKNSYEQYSSQVLMNCVIHKVPSFMLHSIISSELKNSNEYFSKISPDHRDDNPLITGNRRNFPNTVILAKRIYTPDGN